MIFEMFNEPFLFSSWLASGTDAWSAWRNGGAANYYNAQAILPWTDTNGYSYTAWTWNVWNQSSNDLILDTSGTPTQGFGVYFKSHLSCRNAGNC